MKNSKLPARYVVVNQNHVDMPPTSYNTSLGQDPFGCNLALYYARLTAGKYGGEIFTQEADGAEYVPFNKAKVAA